MRSTILFILIFGLSGAAFSQPGIGFSGGGITSIFSTEGESYGGLGSFGGVSFTVPLTSSNKWSIRPEVNYHFRRFRFYYEYNSVAEQANGTYKYEEWDRSSFTYHFIDIPLLIVPKISDNIHIYFGPQFGTAIKAFSKEKSYGKTIYPDGQISESSQEYTSSNMAGIREIGFVAGASYDLNFGLSIEIRGQRSLITWDDQSADGSVAWGIVQLGVRYVLFLKKKSNV